MGALRSAALSRRWTEGHEGVDALVSERLPSDKLLAGQPHCCHRAVAVTAETDVIQIESANQSMPLLGIPILQLIDDEGDIQEAGDGLLQAGGVLERAKPIAASRVFPDRVVAPGVLHENADVAARRPVVPKVGVVIPRAAETV